MIEHFEQSKQVMEFIPQEARFIRYDLPMEIVVDQLEENKDPYTRSTEMYPWERIVLETDRRVVEEDGFVSLIQVIHKT